MKANQLATLVLRLFGIYLLVEFVPVFSTASSIAPFFTSSDVRLSGFEAVEIAMVFLFIAFQIAVGIFLIVKSAPLSEKLTRQIASQENISAVSFEQIQVLAFAVVGILIFAGALPQFFNSIYLFFHSLNEVGYKNPNVSAPFYSWRTLLISVGNFAKAGLGAWMFFGAHGFANFWRSMRNFGTPKPPEN
jgi:hypothetical protein